MQNYSLSGSDNDSSCDSDENYETWDNVAVKGEDIFSSDSALDQSDFHNESRVSTSKIIPPVSFFYSHLKGLAKDHAYHGPNEAISKSS